MSGFWCQMQMSSRIERRRHRRVKDALVGLAAFYAHSWRKKRQACLCVGVDALAQKHFLSSTISSISLWVGSQGVGLNVMDSSCLLLFVCALDLSTCLSLRAGRCPGGIWLHRCGVLCWGGGESRCFLYTWHIEHYRPASHSVLRALDLKTLVWFIAIDLGHLGLFASS